MASNNDPKEPANPFDEPTVGVNVADAEENPFDPPTVKVSVPVTNGEEVDYLTIAQTKAPPLAALPGVPAFTPGSLHSGESGASPFDSDDPGPTPRRRRRWASRLARRLSSS